jgi:hypothetical protein
MFKSVEIKDVLFNQASRIEHEDLIVDKSGIKHGGCTISREVILSILLNDEAPDER